MSYRILPCISRPFNIKNSRLKIALDLYTETLKLALFWLQNGGSTYTRCRLLHGKIRYMGCIGMCRCEGYRFQTVCLREVLPYMGYIGLCCFEGYGFQEV